jgi:hypothetical protein
MRVSEGVTDAIDVVQVETKLFVLIDHEKNAISPDKLSMASIFKSALRHFYTKFAHSIR